MHGCGYLLCVVGRKKAGLGCMHCADSPRISLDQTRPFEAASLAPRSTTYLIILCDKTSYTIIRLPILRIVQHFPCATADTRKHIIRKRYLCDHVGLQPIRRARG